MDGYRLWLTESLASVVHCGHSCVGGDRLPALGSLQGLSLATILGSPPDPFQTMPHCRRMTDWEREGVIASGVEITSTRTASVCWLRLRSSGPPFKSQQHC